MEKECSIEDRAYALASTMASEDLKLMLERAEAAALLLTSSLSVLGNRRIAILRKALELGGGDRGVVPVSVPAAFGRGAVWTELVVAGGALGSPLWKATVSVYMGSKGWSTRHESPLSSIRFASAWAKGEAKRLRKCLAVQLMLDRHAGAERGVATVPFTKVQGAHWGVCGVL